MSEKLLPLGSIVYLQEGIQKVIIVGRGPVIETKNGQRLFDYAASLYPLGINKDHLYFFNKEDIQTVVFEGYSSEEEEQYNKVYADWLATNPAPKGKYDDVM